MWPYIRRRWPTHLPRSSASYLPLLAMVLGRLGRGPGIRRRHGRPGGADFCSLFHGRSAGRASQLRGWPLAGVTSIAAALGLVMVALKDLVLIHLH